MVVDLLLTMLGSALLGLFYGLCSTRYANRERKRKERAGKPEERP